MINEANAYAKNQLTENLNATAYFQANPAEVKILTTQAGAKSGFNADQEAQAESKKRLEEFMQTLKSGKPAAKEYLKKILDQVNSALYGFNKELRFEIDDKTDDLVVKVVNSKTGESIRQYPTDQVLALREKLLAGETQSIEAEG